MIVSVRFTKGLGNAQVYIRLRNVDVEYYDFVGQAWVPAEVADCRIFLLEYPDSSTTESRYQGTITLPSGDVIVEYVHFADELVIAEEFVAASPSQAAGEGPNPVTVTITDGTLPISSALVQASKNGVLLASALTDITGKVLLQLEAGAASLVVSKPSWGAFPLTTYTVVPGSQSLTIIGTESPPSPSTVPSYSLFIPVGDADTRLLAGYSTIEVQSSDDESATWRAMTGPVATAPKLTSSTSTLFFVSGLIVVFEADGVEYTITFSSIAPYLSATQVASEFNEALPGVASALDNKVILTGPTTGSYKVLKIVSVTTSALGFAAGQTAYGMDTNIPIAPSTYVYYYLDPLGVPERRYRWRFSNNGIIPISGFMPWVTGKQQLVGAEISIGTARLASGTGMSRSSSLFVYNISTYNQGFLVVDGGQKFSSDSQGFVFVPLMRGARVKIAIEGTTIVREITVPNTTTFDIMQAVVDAPDEFTIQTTAPLLTRRSL
jgi:hypothetical protein